METPVLYSFRRCPYCIRAHMALKYAGIKVELREVELKNMPPEALKISANRTVPVLLLNDDNNMDESWEIMKWALTKNDPDNWSGSNNQYLLDAEMLVESNDYSFKSDLDHYKYADRFPEQTEQFYRQACEEFIAELEAMLCENPYLLANRLTLADIAVFPFVRQFSLVDKNHFEQSPFLKVRQWLETLNHSKLFQQVFQKHPTWKTGDPAVYI